MISTKKIAKECAQRKRIKHFTQNVRQYAENEGQKAIRKSPILCCLLETH
jgi:hypothetical protein